ncbi:unnamed protein product, partial [Sphacelaria rigidula]
GGWGPAVGCDSGDGRAAGGGGGHGNGGRGVECEWHRSIGDLQPHLLWWRDGKGPDRSIHSAVGPGIGEGEMSAVHFIIHSGTLFQKHLKKWLMTSTDTDQWILVLLAMSCGHIEPQGSNAVQVTVKRIVNEGPRYILVNRVYRAIVTP